MINELQNIVIHEGTSPTEGKCQLIWDKTFKVSWINYSGNQEVCSYEDYSQAYAQYCKIMGIEELPKSLQEKEKLYQMKSKSFKVFMIISVLWSLMAMVKGVATIDILAGFFIINIMGMAVIKIKSN